MIVIGLTGGIASGKSTVSQYLAEHGAVIIDADKVGHRAFEPNTEAWHDVIATFSKSVLQEDDKIDRKKLGGIVFNDPEALKQLNRIMHPRMYKMMEEEIQRLRDQGVEVVVLEAAVLIEANWQPLVDEVWVTVAPETTVIQRLCDRSELTEEQARARFHSQLSVEERAKHADVIIDTDCTLEEVRQKVDKLWNHLISTAVVDPKD